MIDENTPLLSSLVEDQDDPETDSDTTGEEGETRPAFNWSFFLTMQLGAFLALADSSFVLSTHGEIASQFGQLSIGHWLVTGYNLGYSIALPTYGRLYNIHGAKATLMAAYLMFAVGCTITGTAGSIWIAVTGRVLSGVGGSGMVDLISVFIADIAPLKEVAVLRSYISCVTSVGIGLGAPLGSSLTSLVGWRWPFLGQVPIAISCLALAAGRLPSHAPDQNTASPGDPSRREGGLNVLGIFFLGTTTTAFMLFCLSFGEGNGMQQTRPILVGVLFLAGVLFVVNETYWAREPLITLALMKTNRIGIAYVVQILTMFSYLGLVSHVSDFFVRTEYASNYTAGLYILPFSLGSTAGSLSSGHLIRRTGRYKPIALVSLCLALIGHLLIALRWPCGPSHLELIYAFCAAVGAGGLMSTQFVSLSASTPKDQSATVITAYYLSQQLGMITGVTITATISQHVFQNNLLDRLGMNAGKLEIIKHVLRNNRAAQSLPTAMKQAVRSSYLGAFRTVPLSTLCSLLCALPLVLSLPEWFLE